MNEATLRELGIVTIRAVRPAGDLWRVAVRTLRGFEVVTEAETFAAALDHAIREIRTNPETLPN